MRPSPNVERVVRAIEVRGVVQGVGFRPFVWRLATELGLDGTVVNRAGQVEIEVAGTQDAVEAFAGRLLSDAPPRARVEEVLVRALERQIASGSGFAIEESEAVASTERLFP
ncbi:MAG TPA: acylphosphatase, partial [Candidatus Limnocylindrales bacterium]